MASPSFLSVDAFNNATPDGQTNCTPGFQAALDAAATGSKGVYVPPGNWNVWGPVYADQPGVFLTGIWGPETTILTNGYWPAVVFGIRRTETGNRVIGTAFRPDAFGVLDGGAAPRTGVRSGIATRGTVFGIMTGHPAQVGMRSQRVSDRCYDGYGEMTGLCIEFCLSPDANIAWQPFQPIACLGVPVTEPTPWCLSFGADTRTLLLSFKTNLIPEGPGQGSHQLEIPLGAATMPYRGRVNVDFTARQVWAVINNATVATGLAAGTDLGFSSAPGPVRFLTSRMRYAFQIAGQGEATGVEGATTTPVVLWGLRISTAPRPADPGTDTLRYFTADATTLAYLPLTDAPSRMLRMDCGPVADGMPGGIFLLHADAFGGGIGGNFIGDLTIQGGSHGIALGAVTDFTAERVKCLGGMVAAGSVPVVASYPVVLRDCRLTGYDAGVSLWRCDLQALSTNVERGGRTSVRILGGNPTIDGMMVNFVSPQAQLALDILASEYGGRCDVRNLDVDNEGGAGFTEAAVRCELFPLVKTRLNLSGLDVAVPGAGADLVRLVGHTQGGEYVPAWVSARALAGSGFAAALRVLGPGWKGDFDARSLDLNGAPASAGDGLANVNVLT
jgi:hypothetical protein